MDALNRGMPATSRMVIILVVLILVLFCVLMYVFLELPARSGLEVTTTAVANVTANKVNSSSYKCKGVASLYVINGTITPTKEATTTTLTFNIAGLDPSKIVAHHETLSALATDATTFGTLPFDAPSRSLTTLTNGSMSFTFISNSTNVHNYTLFLYT